MKEQKQHVSSRMHTSGGGRYWQEGGRTSLGIKALTPELAAGPGNPTAEAGPETVTTSWGRRPRGILGDAPTAVLPTGGLQGRLRSRAGPGHLWFTPLEELPAGAGGPCGLPRGVVGRTGKKTAGLTL